MHEENRDDVTFVMIQRSHYTISMKRNPDRIYVRATKRLTAGDLRNIFLGTVKLMNEDLRFLVWDVSGSEILAPTGQDQRFSALYVTVKLFAPNIEIIRVVNQKQYDGMMAGRFRDPAHGSGIGIRYFISGRDHVEQWFHTGSTK